MFTRASSRFLLTALAALPLFATAQVNPFALVDESAAGPASAATVLAAQHRAEALVWPILTSSAERCGEDARRLPGFAIHRFELSGFGGDDRLQQMGLQGGEVAAVFEGSPAERAGLKAGDRVQEVNGRSVGKGAKAHNRLPEALDKAARKDRPLELEVERDGQTVSLSIAPTLACDLRVSVAMDTGLAFQDGQPNQIQINARWLNVSRDEDDVRVLLAHEVAHHLGGMAASRRTTKRLGSMLDGVSGFLGGPQIGHAAGSMVGRTKHEIAADALSLELAHDIGVSAPQVLDFWRHATDERKGLAGGFLGTHPFNEERWAKLEAAVAARRDVASVASTQPSSSR